VISSGGTELVFGSDSGTVVSSGGSQVVAGVANNAQILSGGTETVYGSAVATTVDSGGFEQVAAGGIVNGATINGGTLEINSGATAEGTITFVSGGTLRVDGTGNFGASISGFSQPDQLDLSAIAFGSSTTLSFTGNNSSGTLTITDGTHNTLLTLLGQYTAADFTSASDGHGGTLIGYNPPVAAASDTTPSVLTTPHHA
jgi:autotransporter passenger strand-loop-strand repeat protein